MYAADGPRKRSSSTSCDGIIPARTEIIGDHFGQAAVIVDVLKDWGVAHTVAVAVALTVQSPRGLETAGLVPWD